MGSPAVAEGAADGVVTALDRVESAAVRAGRTASESAVELDGCARALERVWSGLSGGEARRATVDAYESAHRVAGHCLFLADVVRVEGSRLVRALVAGGDALEVADADRELTRRLAEVLREAPDDAAGPVETEIRAAADDASAWHALGPVERGAMLDAYPELGDGAGLPAVERDGLNRLRLARMIDAGTAPAAHRALLQYLDADPARMLLSVDGRGHAVVADGDPDRAGRVVTLVPGTGSGLDSVAENAGRSSAVCTAVEAQAPGDCVAVLWQGYDAPQTIPEAAVSDARAREYAADLRTYAAGLDAVERLDGVDSLHDVVGYSYGSVVVGAAAEGGLAADTMLHVGSPGAAVESLAQQQVQSGGTVRPARPEEVYGLASRWDAVPWWSVTGVLGERPGTDDFGGVAVDITDPGTPVRERVHTHSRYFDPGTVSLAEIGRLLAGRR